MARRRAASEAPLSAVLATAASLVAGGCAGWTGVSSHGCTVQEGCSVQVGWVGGAERTYSNEEWRARGELEVVMDQAARDLRCPLESLASTRPYGRAYVVTGCGRRGAFLAFARGDGKWHDAGGRKDIIVNEWRAVDVDAPTEPPPSPMAQPGYLDSARRWIELVERAAKDLACPASDVLPDFIPSQSDAPSTPVAEGCGKRATYVDDASNGYRLVSVVDIK